MSIADPLHIIFGYVEICAQNGFPERFVNLCTAEKIPLWDMRKIGNTIYAKTTLNGFRKIRSPAKNSSMRVQMIKKRGLPFFIDRMSRKTGLIISLSAAIVVLSFLSTRIWVIETDVKDPVEAENVERVYEQAGLKIGMSKRMKVNEISGTAAKMLDSVSWTALNIVGCTAEIKTREMLSHKPLEENDTPSNIVALKDGQVEIIEGYGGSEAVKAGDTVTEGSLLISGVRVDKFENTFISRSRGYIAASTFINAEKETSAKKELLIPKEKKVYSLYILGKVIPLGKSRNSECVFTHKSWFTAGGKRMPFGVFYSKYTDFDTEKITVSQTENLLTAINDYSLESYNRTLHAQVRTQDISVEKGKDKITVSGKYFCFENICREIPLEVEFSPVTEAESDGTA